MTRLILNELIFPIPLLVVDSTFSKFIPLRVLANSFYELELNFISKNQLNVICDDLIF